MSGSCAALMGTQPLWHKTFARASSGRPPPLLDLMGSSNLPFTIENTDPTLERLW